MDAYTAYSQQATITASPAQLVLMLYDGALARIETARLALASDTPDLSEVNTAIGRTQDIVRELQLTLDRDRGGQVAASLASLYDYVQERLLDANLTKTVPPLDDAVRVLGPLRDTWEQACVHGPAAVAG